MIIVVAFLKIILSTVDDEYHLKKIRNYDIELKKMSFVQVCINRKWNQLMMKMLS